MPRLAPQVERPVRVRGRHVVVAGIALSYAILALADRVRETGYPRRTIAREAEARFLDSLELRSLAACPEADMHDPWGDPYQVLCHEDGGRLEVIIVSYGDGDAIVASRSYPQ
jgi:hypothetical protein